VKTAQQPYNLGFVRLAELAVRLKGPCPLKTGQPGSEVQLEVGLGCLWRGRETSYEQAKLRTGGAVACRLQPFRYAYRPREDERVRITLQPRIPAVRQSAAASDVRWPNEPRPRLPRALGSASAAAPQTPQPNAIVPSRPPVS
jgi:hypothetical protein